MIKNIIMIIGAFLGRFLNDTQKPSRMENFARTRNLRVVTQNLRGSARTLCRNPEMTDDYKDAFPDITREADNMWGNLLPSRTDAIYWRYLDSLFEKNDLERAQNLLRRLNPEHVPNILNMNRASNPHINGYDTLIIKAVKAQNYNLVRMLIGHGASVAKPGYDGWTALHHAACNDDAEMIGILKEAYDFNVNVLIEEYQSTPLHMAAFYGNGNAVKRLLELKADHLVKDKMGRRAYDLVNISIERLGNNIMHKDERARLYATRDILAPHIGAYYSRLFGNLP